MRISSDPEARLERALLSLEGLSVGDGFGERFFAAEHAPLIATRTPPPGPWPTTDDTAMALGVVEVLARHGSIVRDELARVFGERYRSEPWRGYGSGAHRILQAIADGVQWTSAASLVFGGVGSLGNGAAMRAPPLGAWFADDPGRLVDEARASAEVTHLHPEGQAGAIAVAVAAAWAVHARGGSRDGHALLAAAAEHTPPGETRQGIVRALSVPFDADVRSAAEELGNGSGAIAPDTVPFALWCAARHLDDFECAMWSCVEAGGDVDTLCAIVGGIVAPFVGLEGIPWAWRDRREPLAVPTR